MHPELLSQISPAERKEKPEFQPAEQEVARQVADLDIGLRLENHPVLLERLAEIGDHFQDSLEMAELIQGFYDRLPERLGLKDGGPARLMRAAVLHDIGKSGPREQPPELRLAVQRLFATPARHFEPIGKQGRRRSIAEFLDEQDFDDRQEIEAGLLAGGISSDLPILDFWRLHAKWTYDLLQAEAGPDVDDGLTLTTASHHLLEGQNPAGLDLRAAPDLGPTADALMQAGLLAAVDKYQAFRVRSGLSHEAALEAIERVAAAARLLPVFLDGFRGAIEALKQSSDVIDRSVGSPRTN